MTYTERESHIEDLSSGGVPVQADASLMPRTAPGLGWQVYPAGPVSENLREQEAFQKEAWGAEGPQNVVDALLSHHKTARLKVSIKSLGKGILNKYVGDLRPHHEKCAEENPHRYKFDFHDGDGFVLLLEDFNTTGLLGPLTKRPDRTRFPRNFEGLLLSSGDVANKARGKLGSRGQGKITFAAASAAFCWFAYSIRIDHESPDPAKRVLMGRTRLRPHWIGTTEFGNHGHWGMRAANGKDPVNACTSEAQLDEFVGDFGLARGQDESGTSIIIPYYIGEREPSKVILYLLERNYALILQDRLEIEVSIETSDRDFVLSSESIRDVVQTFLTDSGDSRWTDLLTRIDRLREMIAALADTQLHLMLPVVDSPTSSESYLNRLPENLRMSLIERFRVENRLVVRIPVKVAEKTLEGGRRELDGVVDVALFKDPDMDSHWPEFLRDGLRIAPDVNSSMLARKISNVCSILKVDGGENNGLQMLLRASEPGAHDRWEPSTDNFLESWHEGKSWVNFAKYLPAGLVEFLQDNRESLDLSGFSFLSDPNPDEQNTEAVASTGTGDAAGRNQRTPRPRPPVTDSNPKPIHRVYEDAGRGCYQLTLGALRPSKFELRVAYDTDEGSPFSKYDPIDFDFAKMRAGGDIEIVGGEIREAEGNRVLVEVSDPGKLKLEIKGFDTRRVPVFAYNDELASSGGRAAAVEGDQ